MIQAQNFTAGTAYGQAIETLKIPDHERFGLTYQLLLDYLHDAVLQWYSTAELVVKQKYVSRIAVSGISSYGTYNSPSGANYTAATNTLTISGANFTSAALGASVLLFNGTTVYRGTISQIQSTTQATLVGLELPGTNLASVQGLVWGRSQDISIGSLGVGDITLRDGVPTNVAIESDLLGDVPFLGPDAYRYVLGSPTGYTNGAFASLYADVIKIFKGSSVSSLGNLTLVAPLQPTKASASTTLLSVPDNFCPDVIDLLTIRIARHLTQQPDQSAVNRAKDILNFYGVLSKANVNEAR
jgi:hypothetical protein